MDAWRRAQAAGGAPLALRRGVRGAGVPLGGDRAACPSNWVRNSLLEQVRRDRAGAREAANLAGKKASIACWDVAVFKGVPRGQRGIRRLSGYRRLTRRMPMISSMRQNEKSPNSTCENRGGENRVSAPKHAVEGPLGCSACCRQNAYAVA